MARFGFLIDNRKCIGCHACTVACKSEHQVPIGVDRTWVKCIEKGAFPNNRRMFSVMRCNHCEHSPCTTICPVTALYRRDDGIVDFNSERCIGCKACMQACPYDALYIDPESGTAAKCNFCSHRLDSGLEPSCVAVCPEQAIVMGDLDDPASKISMLTESHAVQVRKPEKGTQPKLFYIDADEASLVPDRTEADRRFLWSRGDASVPTFEPLSILDGQSHREMQQKGAGTPHVGLEDLATTNRVYDVRPRQPAWGWEVAGYTWTKSIAAGAFLVAAVERLLGSEQAYREMSVWMGVVALFALIATTGLLIADLKQPKRFLYVLLRPQWNSWLVRGAFALVSYGGLLSIWLIAGLVGATQFADALLWPGVILATLTAVYTAFLFSQAKGRDFWQSPLLGIHLLAHALLSGGAIWLIHDVLIYGQAGPISSFYCFVTLAFSLVTLAAELFAKSPTVDAQKAIDMIVARQPMAAQFWIAGVIGGHLLPIVFLAIDQTWAAILAATSMFVGVFVIERLWILAPQKIPLS